MSYGAPSSSPATGRTVRIEREARAIVVKRHDAVIASSQRAVIAHGIQEGPVYYVPREDVYMEHLVASDDGSAPADLAADCTEGREADREDGRTFLSVTASGGGVSNAAWMHPRAEGDLAPLRDHVGFDPAIFSVTAG